MRYILLILIMPAILFCENKDCVILHARPGAGMFSIWMDVLSLVNEYEKGNYTGIEVNLDGGAYLDPDHGSNWWQYYCEPIREGARNDPYHFMGDPPGALESIENNLTRHQAKHLIDKYIHVKPEIIKSVDEFVEDNFKGYIICVHYRGSDKVTETQLVPYNDVIYEVVKIMLKIDRPFKIMLATDDLRFLELMIDSFRNKVCYLPSVRTYGNVGLHHSDIDKYQHGLDAIKDMLLLSKGDVLIRTSSNLSRWSSWFNPDIPVIELNQLGF